MKHVETIVKIGKRWSIAQVVEPFVSQDIVMISWNYPSTAQILQHAQSGEYDI